MKAEDIRLLYDTWRAGRLTASRLMELLAEGRRDEMKEHRIVIDKATGEARFVYDDALAPLAALGRVERASHVEPATDFGLSSGWVADMRPSGGGLLIAPHPDGSEGPYHEIEADGIAALPQNVREGWLVEGFRTREAALAAERAWLRKEKGL